MTLKKIDMSTITKAVKNCTTPTMKVKQSIEYEGKKIPLPFLIARDTLNTKMTKVRNRFNGNETELPEFAVAVYDVILGSELYQDDKTMRKGLDFFIKYFPKQYMVLLD